MVDCNHVHISWEGTEYHCYRKGYVDQLELDLTRAKDVIAIVRRRLKYALDHNEGSSSIANLLANVLKE